MQAAVPELTDLAGESPAVKKLYGVDSTYEPTRIYGTQCLLARRLVERGVRFIELTCPVVGSSVDRWDQHGNLKDGHDENCRAVDQPIAALLTDLKSRGLLDSTLVVWAGEFGRTPFAQGRDGPRSQPVRLHGVARRRRREGRLRLRRDRRMGLSRSRGQIARCTICMRRCCTCSGIDHTKLTVRFGGRDMRLTDVHGNVVRAIVAKA